MVEFAIFPYVGGFLAIIVIGGFIYFIGKGRTKRGAARDAVSQAREYFPKEKKDK